jgi:NDP-sugar pyrophosphorylase family protein
MIAIIVAAAKKSEMYGLDEHLPLPLFPLVDRPILHHIVDSLASQGIRRFEFVLGHLPEKIETYLGDGARWGCAFGFHLLPSESDPLRMVETIATGLNDEVVLGQGDRLPDFQLWTVPSATLFMTDAGAWTGWAVLPRASRLFASLRSYASGEVKIHDLGFQEVVVNRELTFENAPQLLRSQHALLTGAFSGSTVGGCEKEPGIWISRNVTVHPTAKLLAPVYIGPNCRIGIDVRIGPSAVISEGCIVDEQSSVANSVVAPRTYIGRGLELEHVIVDRNRLVNAKLETAFLVSESFLLSGLARQKKPRMLYGLISRWGALALFLLLFPIAGLTLVFLLLTGKGELVYEPALRLPAAYNAQSRKQYCYLRVRLQAETMAGWWTYFVAEVWPGLISVMKGDMFLVGVRPRSRREVEKLSDDWRSIYLSSKGGLITEAFVMFGRAPSEDELYTAEAYYTATESVGHDLKLLHLYMCRLLINGSRSRAGFPGDSVPESLPEKLLGH